MKDVLAKTGIRWKGWHGFRRGLASNLNQLGVDDSVIQGILRHSTVAVTQRCYIKTTTPEAEAAMRKLSVSMPLGTSQTNELREKKPLYFPVVPQIVPQLSPAFGALLKGDLLSD